MCLMCLICSWTYRWPAGPCLFAVVVVHFAVVVAVIVTAALIKYLYLHLSDLQALEILKNIRKEKEQRMKVTDWLRATEKLSVCLYACVEAKNEGD